MSGQSSQLTRSPVVNFRGGYRCLKHVIVWFGLLSQVVMEPFLFLGVTKILCLTLIGNQLHNRLDPDKA